MSPKRIIITQSLHGLLHRLLDKKIEKKEKVIEIKKTEYSK